jgi:integrase
VRIDDHAHVESAEGAAIPFLPPDNALISPLGQEAVDDRPAISAPIASAGFAVTCKLGPTDTVRAYVEAGIAPATRRAYKTDLEHFRAWGGSIPTTDLQLAAYLAEQATILKAATLTRRLAAISIAHKAQRLTSPISSPLVRATMRGVRREHGTAQRQAAPLLREDLFVVLGAMGDRLKDLRDRALLLIGFAGGFRRSELAAINLIDVERVREGIILTIRRSKTDQDGVGRKIGVPLGRTTCCPVRALQNWLSASRIEDGPVSRSVDRHGRVSASRLSGEAVSLILRERVAAAGFDPTGYSGHSLRTGFATSATRAGVSTFKIRQQTGHASDAMLSRYVREGELFLGNASGVLL